MYLDPNFETAVGRVPVRKRHPASIFESFKLPNSELELLDHADCWFMMFRSNVKAI